MNVKQAVLGAILIVVGVYPAILTELIDVGVRPVAQQLSGIIVAGR